MKTERINSGWRKSLMFARDKVRNATADEERNAAIDELSHYYSLLVRQQLEDSERFAAGAADAQRALDTGELSTAEECARKGSEIWARMNAVYYATVNLPRFADVDEHHSGDHMRGICEREP